ncbi:MAG: hypothetical protein RQ757_03850 [Pseudomonadales bacterium]|nr:hypothetical protein [Pseudomonadales bacterium]
MLAFKRVITVCSIALLLQQAAAQDRLVIDGVSYRDPTQPLGALRIQGQPTVRQAARSYAVSFIRTGGDVNVAIVNGQTVAVGDVVDGARVVQISEDTVRLDTGDEVIDISTFRADFRSSVQ